MFDDIFSHLDTIHQGNSQTDRHRDTAKTAFRIASRSKTKKYDALRRNVLQVSHKCEEVRMGYLDSTAECSMEAFQDVIRSVPVVADTVWQE